MTAVTRLRLGSSSAAEPLLASGLASWNYVAVRVLQGDSFEVSSELKIINHAENYRRKRSMASTYFGRRGVNWVTEDVEIQFLPGWRQAVCSRMWPISMAGQITETRTAH